jgi:hypothetical protein
LLENKAEDEDLKSLYEHSLLFSVKNPSNSNSVLPPPQFIRARMRQRRHRINRFHAKEKDEKTNVEATSLIENPTHNETSASLASSSSSSSGHADEAPETLESVNSAIRRPAWFDRELNEPVLPFLLELLYISSCHLIYHDEEDGDGSSSASDGSESDEHSSSSAAASSASSLSTRAADSAARRLRSLQRQTLAKDLMSFLSLLCANSSRAQNDSSSASSSSECINPLSRALIELGGVPLLARLLCCTRQRDISGGASSLLQSLLPPQVFEAVEKESSKSKKSRKVSSSSSLLQSRFAMSKSAKSAASASASSTSIDDNDGIENSSLLRMDAELETLMNPQVHFQNFC